MARTVRIFEVGPRDGLQNEARSLPIEQKVEFITRLVASGLREIEVGAFVHPRWIPQLADTDTLVPRLPRVVGVNYWALIPNRRGLERALAAGITHGCLLMSASESHSRKNLNRSIAERLDENRELAVAATAAGLTLRGYVSVVFGCPYEGEIAPAMSESIADALFEYGVREVSFGDTTGMGHPEQVRHAARRWIDRYGASRIGFHFHDTRGTGLANAYAVLGEGAVTLDTSAGGIGGCPYAPGAAGNLATEDLVHLVQRMGFEAGVDLQRLIATSRWLRDEVGLAIDAKYFRFAASS